MYTFEKLKNGYIKNKSRNYETENNDTKRESIKPELLLLRL